MKSMLSIIALLVFVPVFSQDKRDQLIPQPLALQKLQGIVEFRSNSVIAVNTNDSQVLKLASYLEHKLESATGYDLKRTSTVLPSNANFSTIFLSLNNSFEESLGNEGYHLDILENKIALKANRAAGLFYAIQTLLQLFPNEIEAAKGYKTEIWRLPACSITDKPRFAWRGLMLDVSRHFFTTDEVKRFIDDMVKYKFNRLHWHLTDDQGWRLEIKSLPKLTEVGAWRAPREGRMSQMSPPAPGEPLSYGGYYTQNDVKEIVQYARDRFVEVLPEVDVPGHSMAFIASYPELSCTPGTYRVNSGEKLMNWFSGGFEALVDNALCPANEKTYDYLDKVFTEVAALFPFEYIHMGGDECAKNFWAKSAAVKELIQKEQLKDLHEVQSYFVKRVEKIIASKGKKLMGWDEILEGGLPENAAVMSWRGEKGGIEASRLKHPVVMSPTTFAYLDYNQGEAYVEPPIYASLRLNKTYQFEPVPIGALPEMILGGQANLWTEQVPSLRAAQYMIWPRGWAIAESVWSPREKKNWPDFAKRVEAHFERMDLAETKYAKTIYDPIVQAKKSGENGLRIELATEIPGIDIYFSLDETHPDAFYPKYELPFEVPKDAIHLKLITYRNGKPIGRQIDLPIQELRKRAGYK